MSELLNTDQVAQMLQVTAGTLMVWRCTKKYPLRFVKIGRNVRYRASDVEEFLRARTMSGVPAEIPSRARHGRAARA
jgi:excisionase family DNA binding protein